jgi:hypothetical protein
LSSTSKDILRELLGESLLAWGLDGTVQSTSEGSVLLSCKAAEVRVQPAPPDLPFRWMVTVDNRTRGAISLIAVLRQVRSALDPDYAANRVRIAFPPVPS